MSLGVESIIKDRHNKVLNSDHRKHKFGQDREQANPSKEDRVERQVDEDHVRTIYMISSE
ncbi:hypothetical protein BYT27DRAFT_7183557 [Phlegmacium glaucopus]|nr:hypothetical protein BYT27DRAFT_7183557 [Phlegmacium glaucopus]